ncbi:mono/diheme cytochrome c family protein [Povalibacter uvarum]|uniref:Mono/diheme cytochrome c family protein n=1 Tax=Povalibacter uvarum TaxID=732238 RepID=A0A841HI99_9GAMM|nr:PKD domain-containing protein [Povalibacter uvarum]MBB6092020.1 mono/diheme cytochrome c family protein [Povalibacter uvarum]
MSLRICRATTVCLAAWLAACSGLSDVGNQEKDDAPPIADAVVLNQPYSKDAAGKVTTRVRSGAEVFLSGNDSDGVVVPVLKLEWTLVTTGAVANQVQLVDRNSTTVSFKAPQVTADTTLQFRLTVTDSNGATDQADVDVTVVAVADPDRFLTHLQAPQKFTLVAVADSTTALTADVPFDIRMQRTISYIDLRGLQRTATPPAETLRGTWLATEGAGASCDDYQNPRFSVELPKLDVNAISAAVRADRNRTASELPDLSRIDSATTEVSLSITQTGAALPAGRQALLCIRDASGNLLPDTAQQSLTGKPPMTGSFLSSVAVNADRLMGDLTGPAGRTIDTRDSAQKYYDTIDDPVAAQRKRSFLGWLKENGFIGADATSLQWSQVEAGSTAHAVYVNNFDLGFGRDMYARRFDCVNPRSTTGECVASVVVNYSSMENAAKKLDPILAVAMEYTVTPYSQGKKVVKFYTYAPNETSGDFDQIHSVDLDGRGEKFMPGACTICHGGTPQGIDAQNPDLYAAGGDVNSSFLPWDLDSFLYSDSQAAAWVPDPTDATENSLHSRYKRTPQESQFRELNRLAYQTYVDDPARPGRHDLARDLVETWYGDAVDGPTFQNRVPAEWSADAAAQNIYRTVFAQHCRMCHVAHVPNVSTQTGEYQPYVGCNATPRITQYGSNSPGQIAFGCYDQFVAAGNLISVLQRGVMPNARLTMDRYWVSGSGDSPAKVLATHLQSVTGRTDLLNNAGNPVPPGRPVLDVEINDNQYENTPIEVARNAPVQIDGADSQLAATYAWDLCLLREGATDCSALPLVGGSTSQPSFTPRAAGDYRLTLTATSTLGATATQTYTARVLNRLPNIASCPTEQGAANNVQQPISLATCIQDGDGVSTVQIQNPTTMQWVSSITNTAYQAAVSGKVINFTHALTAIAPAALNYRVCDEDPADCATGLITVNIDSTLATTGDQFDACISNDIDDDCNVLPLTIAVNTLLANDTVLPSNDAVTLTILNQPAQGIVSPTTAVRNESIEYSSTTVNCDVTGANISNGTTPCTGARFRYMLTSGDGSTDSNESEIVVRVRATTSFSLTATGVTPLNTTFAACQGCHQTGGIGDDAWVRDANNATNSYNSINGSGLLDGATPEDAPIYSAPCLGTGHGTGFLNADQCEVVLQWVREGANLR